MPHSSQFHQVPSGHVPTADNELQRPPGLVNYKASPNFEVVCNMFKNLAENPKRKREILMGVMEAWRKNVGPDLYPLLRLLLPARDRERPIYGLKEQSIARCYIEVLGLDRNSIAAQRLIKWKQPVPGEVNNDGDFPSRCYEAILSRKSMTERNDLTVQGINELLIELSGKNKQGDYNMIFRTIMHHCTAQQQRWLIRIILKDLKISVGDKTVFNIFHPDANELFNVCSDLKRVCWTLYDPSFRLNKNDKDIELMRSFMPQLCKRTASHDLGVIAKNMRTKPFIIEEKLDGERMQLHKKGNVYFYCSRKGKDYTYLYGGNPNEGSLTPHIHSMFRGGVDNCILDGEMLVWDPLLEKYLAFGSLKTAALDRSNDPEAPRPCFKVFDIVFANGKSLVRIPLKTRKEMLYDPVKNKHTVFEPLKGRMELADQWEGSNGLDIKERLQEVMELRGEGLVIKDPMSRYVTNSREADWCKVKPEYADEMGENVDCLVIGGWWGTGKRGGKIASLLCGLRNEATDDGSGAKPTFKTFMKVGGGFSFADFQWIEDNHRKDWIEFDRHRPPKWMTVGRTGNDDKPDVYIEPDKSFVIAVKASEFIKADENFGFEFCCRFPRAKRIMWDEASRGDHAGEGDVDGRIHDMWTAMSVEDVLHLIEETPKRKYKDDQTQKAKKRKINRRVKASLDPAFAGQKVTVQVESDIFEGIKFLICSGTNEYTPRELEVLVKQNGGTFCQRFPPNEPGVIIAKDFKKPVAASARRTDKDVIKPEWILESIKNREVLPFIKELVLHASSSTLASENYDIPLSSFDPSQAKPTPSPGSVTASESDEMDVDDPPKAPEQLEPKDFRLGEEWIARTTGKVEPEDEESEDDGGSEREELSDEEGPVATGQNGESDTEDDEDEEQQSRFQPPPGVFEPKAPSPVAGEEENDEDGKGINDDEEADEVFKSKIGSDDEAINYDPDKVRTAIRGAFNCYKLDMLFYIDSDVNAATNGLTRSKSGLDKATDSLNETAEKVTTNGGRLTTSLQMSKLTHIIQHPSDKGRHNEIVRSWMGTGGTGKGMAKHVVTGDWVEDCLEEGTLLDEDAYKP